MGMSFEDYYIVKAYDFKDTRQRVTGMLVELVVQYLVDLFHQRIW